MPPLVRPRVALLALVAALTLAACTAPADPASDATARPAPGPSTAADGGVFYAFLRQPSSIDPATAVDVEDLSVVGHVFDSLTATGPGLEVVPGAAASWESNGPPATPEEPPAGTVWTFHLRPGATFHDGQPVTAASFAAAWERIVRLGVERPSPAFYLLEPVRGFSEAQTGGALSGVVAVDDHTLRVELSEPFAAFPAVVSHPALAPVPAEAVSDPEAFGRSPVGNGPFRMAADWQPGSEAIRLEAWDDHPTDQATIDQLVFRIYQGDDAAAAGYEDFLRGSLDLAPIPTGRTQEAIERFGASEDGYSGPGVLDGIKLIAAWYGFNTERAPFNDPAVRQGLSLLVDRDTIVGEVVDDGRAVARSLVPPGIDGYEPAECGVCTYDPGRATGLLAGKVGPEAPVELTIYDDPQHKEVADRVAHDVNAALGAGTMTVRTLPQAEWLDAIRSGDAGFFLSGWLAEYPSPDAFLHPQLHQGRVGSDNLTRYQNPQVTELLDRARAELDPATRRDLYRQAEAAALADVPIVPLFFYRHARVVAERVEGLHMDPLGHVDMTRVRLTGSE